MSTTNNNNQKGIDIKEALKILSARSSSQSGDSESKKENDGYDCYHGTQLPDNAKTMGQIIDLLGKQATQFDVEASKQKQEQQKIQRQRAERHEKIQQELNSMSETKLLQAVLKAQEDRVKTYREYESGLVTVLQTGNMTNYPDTCLKATASFSVLSETVKAIQSIFEASNNKEVFALLGNLQAHEKEKLHLTAAHHLERIRQKNEKQQPDQDPGTTKMLEDGVASLQRKLATCIKNINEVIDEIRCLLMDMD